MANKLFGEARLTLSDGQELTIRFDFNALCEAEEAANASTEAMMKAIAGGSPRLKIARAMLYGGLRHHHPDMALDEVGELFMSDAEAVSEAMGEAMAEMAARKEALNPRKRAAVAPTPSPWDWELPLESWCESGLSPELFWLQTPRTFKPTMRGRLKFQRNSIVLQAHQNEVMARQKRLHGDPEFYLKPRTPAKRGPSQVVAMFKRLAAAGADVTITSNPEGEKGKG